MAKFDYDIAVLGGGSAGLTVTAGASQFGAKTLLIEKENRLGGDCLHYGCVPSKTLIKTAKVYHLIRNARKFGLPNAEISNVDFKDVANRIRSVIDIIQKHDSPERFCKFGAKVEFGQPAFVDEHSISLNGKKFSAKSLVIATGSSPAIPPIEGLEKIPYITNKEIFYLDDLPKSMIIIGAGPISTEMAQAFTRLGTNVTVIQRGNQILSREDKDMADSIMNVLSEEGVKFFLNTTILKARDAGNEKEVVAKTGDGNTLNLRAEKIMVAVGRTANLKGLGLEKIGIEYNTQGLKLDSRLRTKQKHIFGAGDVTGTYLFTHAAGYEGGVVVTNAILHLPRRADYSLIPWCTYTDPELASIGLNEKSAKKAGIEYSVWTEEFKMNDRSLAEGSTVGKIKMLLNAKKKPIGVQILGLHAGELLSEWIGIFNGKISLSTIAGAVHPYPTLNEINKKIASNYFSSKIFSDKVKKTLKFFFDFKGRACE